MNESIELFDFPDWWWDSFDSFDADEAEDEDYLPCCICSCLIGSEVGFGMANYWGDGRPICDQCLNGMEDDDAEALTSAPCS